MYSREEIEKVRSAVDIVEIIREYVPSLNASGRSVKGLCPFHNEKTPSFFVQPDKGFFKCFGCGEAGDVIAFLSKMEQVPFSEALERLASRAGIILKKERSADRSEPEGIREKIWRICETAKNFYVAQLWDSKTGNSARSYLKKRDIREDTIREFELGFAPAAGEGLVEHLAKKNFSIDLCQQAGLASRSNSGRYYDPLYGRLIFPIFDGFGHVIGFGGRVLPQVKRSIPGLTDVLNEDEPPKYINSPETPVFSKGKTLYGLAQAKSSIMNERRAVILEGYMDVIGLHQGGFKASVATLGTAFTRDHAKVLKRYADHAVAFFDPDEAGHKAAVRGLDPLLQEGIYPQVVLVQGSLDPDEILLQQGPEEFQNILKLAPDFVSYLLTVSGVSQKSPLDERSRVAGEILAIIAQSTNEILKSEWTAQVARSLGIAPDSLKKELIKKESHHEGSGKAVAQASKKTLPNVEEEYLQLLFLVGVSGLSEDLSPHDFNLDREKKLFLFLKKEVREKTAVTLPAVYDAMAEEDRAWLSDLLMEQREFDDPLERRDQLVRSIKTKRDRERLAVLSEKMKSGDVSRDVQEEFNELLKKIKGSPSVFKI